MVVANQTAFNKGDLCLQVFGQYILDQDRYIMEVKAQNLRYLDMLL